MNSIWLEHPKYPGYRFSPEGNCLSLRQGRNKIRKLSKKSGYYFVALYNGNGNKQVHIHRILAEMFLEPPTNGRNHVNHKDGSPLNNSLDNLEWVTHAENRKHACRVLRKGIGERNGNSKLKENEVLEIKKMLSENVFQKTIAKKFGVSRTTISWINCGGTWNNRRDYK